TPSSTAPTSTAPSSTTPAPSDMLAQLIDAMFQEFDVALLSLESKLTAIDPQLSGFFFLLNGNLDALEANVLSKVETPSRHSPSRSASKVCPCGAAGWFEFRFLTPFFSAWAVCTWRAKTT